VSARDAKASGVMVIPRPGERPADSRKGKSEEEAPWLNDPMTASTA
jgi:hypothetical protein